MLKSFIPAVGLLAGLAAAVLAAPVQAGSAGSEVVGSGTFEGRSNHVTTGGVSILKTASGHVAVLEPDFSLDGAPAPTLGFGKSGKFDKASEFSELESKDGLQVYKLPANIDPAAYNEFYVWCAKFSVPLGVAKLEK